MNETYWVVVMPDGNKAHWTFAGCREETIRKYAYLFTPSKSPGASSSERIRRAWRKQYRKGARCKKVRLVLEE